MLKVTNDSGSGFTTSKQIAAMNWVASNHLSNDPNHLAVMNLSFGGYAGYGGSGLFNSSYEDLMNLILQYQWALHIIILISP